LVRQPRPYFGFEVFARIRICTGTDEVLGGVRRPCQRPLFDPDLNRSGMGRGILELRGLGGTITRYRKELFAGTTVVTVPV
jgi:hypothetical protein